MDSQEFVAEYARLGHAIQTGVAFEMNSGASSATEPKHLRIGLICVMADLGSIVRLLVSKGVITEAEYFDAILDGLRREIGSCEARLTERTPGGARITLA